MKAAQKVASRGSKAVTKSSKKTNGSDFSSARGSEERHLSVAAPGGRAGQRRNRDYDIETVCIGSFNVLPLVVCFPHQFASDNSLDRRALSTRFGKLHIEFA